MPAASRAPRITRACARRRGTPRPQRRQHADQRRPATSRSSATLSSTGSMLAPNAIMASATIVDNPATTATNKAGTPAGGASVAAGALANSNSIFGGPLHCAARRRSSVRLASSKAPAGPLHRRLQTRQLGQGRIGRRSRGRGISGRFGRQRRKFGLQPGQLRVHVDYRRMLRRAVRKQLIPPPLELADLPLQLRLLARVAAGRRLARYVAGRQQLPLEERIQLSAGRAEFLVGRADRLPGLGRRAVHLQLPLGEASLGTGLGQTVHRRGACGGCPAGRGDCDPHRAGQRVVVKLDLQAVAVLRVGLRQDKLPHQLRLAWRGGQVHDRGRRAGPRRLGWRRRSAAPPIGQDRGAEENGRVKPRRQRPGGAAADGQVGIAREKRHEKVLFPGKTCSAAQTLSSRRFTYLRHRHAQASELWTFYCPAALTSSRSLSRLSRNIGSIQSSVSRMSKGSAPAGRSRSAASATRIRNFWPWPGRAAPSGRVDLLGAADQVPALVQWSTLDAVDVDHRPAQPPPPARRSSPARV